MYNILVPKLAGVFGKHIGTNIRTVGHYLINSSNLNLKYKVTNEMKFVFAECN